MITHSVSPTKNGNFCAEVIFCFGNRKHRLPRYCSELPRAIREVNYLKKKILLNELQKFINHRRKVIGQYGGLATAERLNAIVRMQLIIDMSSGPKCSLLVFAMRIVSDYAALASLIPGANSRFYENQRSLVSELLMDCSNIIKEYAHESPAN